MSTSIDSHTTDIPPRCSFVPGSELYIHFMSTHSPISTPLDISLAIENAYKPFTQSQVLRVRLPPPIAASAGLPSTAILKVFAHRFTERSDHPWSSAVQEVADARARSIAADEHVDDCSDVDSDHSDAFGPAHWEERFRRHAHSEFEAEREAYARLADFQGASLLRCFSIARVHPRDTHAILEYVEGPTLESLPRISRAQTRFLVSTAHAFGSAESTAATSVLQTSSLRAIVPC